VSVVVIDTVYWLQLAVDGYPDRARLLASAERWSGDPEKREIADLLVQLLDRWDDEIEAAREEEARDVEDQIDNAHSAGRDEVADELGEEIVHLRDELDDVVRERNDLRVQNAEGRCPRCDGSPAGSSEKCPGGLARE
jgi:hypothetical protein